MLVLGRAGQDTVTADDTSGDCSVRAMLRALGAAGERARASPNTRLRSMYRTVPYPRHDMSATL